MKSSIKTTPKVFHKYVQYHAKKANINVKGIVKSVLSKKLPDDKWDDYIVRKTLLGEIKPSERMRNAILASIGKGNVAYNAAWQNKYRWLILKTPQEIEQTRKLARNESLKQAAKQMVEPKHPKKSIVGKNEAKRRAKISETLKQKWAIRKMNASIKPYRKDVESITPAMWTSRESVQVDEKIVTGGDVQQLSYKLISEQMKLFSINLKIAESRILMAIAGSTLLVIVAEMIISGAK